MKISGSRLLALVLVLVAGGHALGGAFDGDAGKGKAGRLGEVRAILERNLTVRTAMAKGPGLKNGADFIGSGAVKVSAWGTPDACRFMVERDDCYYDMGGAGVDKSGQKYGKYWRLGPLMAGELQFDMSALKGAACRQEQDLYRAEVRMSAAEVKARNEKNPLPGPFEQSGRDPSVLRVW